MFNQNNLDLERVKKAKKDAAGPLGQEMAKYSLRFAAALYFGLPPIKGSKPNIRNGTATIVDFGKGPMIITAYHVMDAYKEWREKEKIIFQIGNLKVDPLPRIISESQEFDLVTITISEKERLEIASEGEIGRAVYSPSQWPPDSPTGKDWVIFGGFPGKWRQYPSSGEIIFDSFSCGATEITSVSENKFLVKFSRKYWAKSFDFHGHDELHDLGGLSGAPCFLIKKLSAGLMIFPLIGIIRSFNANLDAMYVSLVKHINSDGTIV